MGNVKNKFEELIFFLSNIFNLRINKLIILFILLFLKKYLISLKASLQKKISKLCIT